jgi:hypothetical protein
MLTNAFKRSRRARIFWLPLLRIGRLASVLVPWRTCGWWRWQQQLRESRFEVVVIVAWARQFAQGEALQLP